MVLAFCRCCLDYSFCCYILVGRFNFLNVYFLLFYLKKISLFMVKNFFLFLLIILFIVIIYLKNFFSMVLAIVVFVINYLMAIEFYLGLLDILDYLLDLYMSLPPFILYAYDLYAEYTNMCDFMDSLLAAELNLWLTKLIDKIESHPIYIHLCIIYLIVRFYLYMEYFTYLLTRKEPTGHYPPKDELCVDLPSPDDPYVLEPFIAIVIIYLVIILGCLLFRIGSFILNILDKRKKKIKDDNEKKKAMPQLDIAIISYVLIVLIIFFIIGYLFTLVIINRIYYIVMIRNYFFVKFEFNLIQQLDNFLLKNNFLLYLLDLKVIGLSELLIENIINNFINYLLLIKKIYLKLNF